MSEIILKKTQKWVYLNNSYSNNSKVYISQLSVTLLCNVNIILTLVTFKHFPFSSLKGQLTMHTSGRSLLPLAWFETWTFAHWKHRSDFESQALLESWGCPGLSGMFRQRCPSPKFFLLSSLESKVLSHVVSQKYGCDVVVLLLSWEARLGCGEAPHLF